MKTFLKGLFAFVMLIVIFYGCGFMMNFLLPETFRDDVFHNIVFGMLWFMVFCCVAFDG